MNMKKKDSILFKPLAHVAETYLREFCNGKQMDDDKARIALRVLSVYRRILKLEKEKEEIKSEWEKLITGVAELKKLSRQRPKPKQRKEVKTARSGSS
jgi:hypothetical protein